MTTLRPVLCGEILFDTWPDGTAVLGGAPVNVAVHLARLGERPLMIGRVGADAAGDRARAELAAHGVDTSGVQVDPRAPTGRVEVVLEAGQPRYEIVPDAAWDALDAAAAATALATAGPALLGHGLLMARTAGGRAAVEWLRAAAPACVVVDVNLRPPWTPPGRALSVARGADWLKVNDAELTQLAALGDGEVAAAGRADEAARLLAATGAARLVVTRGADGAELYGGGGRLAVVPAASLAPGALVDPVGAGDAFTAVVILGLLRGWPEAWVLARGAQLAAAVCTLRGALPSDAAFHEPFREAWCGGAA